MTLQCHDIRLISSQLSGHSLLKGRIIIFVDNYFNRLFWLVVAVVTARAFRTVAVATATFFLLKKGEENDCNQSTKQDNGKND